MDSEVNRGMSIESPQLDVLKKLSQSEDPRYQLVQRILATPDFIRSPQLSRFLLYISTTTFEGRSHILSEQHIGVVVFGREPDYDSAADTIVRSHALRLRRRLEQFFQRGGNAEPLLLTIPRGGYVPVFSPSTRYSANTKENDSHSNERTPDAIVQGSSHQNETSSPLLDRHHTPHEATSRSPAIHSVLEPLSELPPDTSFAQTQISPGVLWRYRVITALSTTLSIGLVITLVLHLRTHFITRRHHILWSQLFTEDQPTQVVLGDSGLVLFHAVARQRVSLHDYLNDDVSKQMPFVQHVEPDFARFLLHRRYTSMVDATALTHLLRLPEAMPERTLVHYSRDMHLNDFKSGNVIMIGAQEAVPWVELFENHMDFAFSIDNPDTHAVFLNRHPAPGELSSYSSYSSTTKTKAYSVLAFLPNLSGTGNVLILEGLSMVGTEAAVDLAMDDERLLPILAKIRKPNGSLPHFEMLLESETLGDSAGPAKVVGVHLHD